jgi:hypothetical protein
LALPVGSYSVDAPLCASTGAPPDYPDGTHKAALYAFDGLTTHTLAVDRFNVTETFQDPNCLMATTQGIYENFGSRYGVMHGRHFAFTPADCTLTLTAGGGTYKAGPQYSAQFQNSDDGSEELPYDVTATADGFLLESVDEADLDTLWLPYGCAKSDRISQALHTIP